MNYDKNCLSYWFPLIKDVVPVPKTAIIKTELDLSPLLDNFRPVPGFDELVEQVSVEADKMGYPAFMRTGHTSGKHSWLNTCFIPDRNSIAQHMLNLIEYSEMVDIFGLPYKVWVVREMLPTWSIGRAFDGMPVCREFRVFVDGADIKCCHEYWPREAFKNGVPVGYSEMCELPDSEWNRVCELASRAGKAVGGAWSVDVLETTRGYPDRWYVTDMAVAEDSWHWPECQNSTTDKGLPTRTSGVASLIDSILTEEKQ